MLKKISHHTSYHFTALHEIHSPSRNSPTSYSGIINWTSSPPSPNLHVYPGVIEITKDVFRNGLQELQIQSSDAGDKIEIIHHSRIMSNLGNLYWRHP